MLSMTGFGRATAEAGEHRFAVEVRTVNHRGLDVKIRSREPDSLCDAEITKVVRRFLERGSVTVTLRDERAEAAAGVDRARIRELLLVLEELRRELGIAEPVGLATVAAFMRDTTSGGGLRGEALWEALRGAVEGALQEVQQSRAREGAELARDLVDRLQRLRGLAAQVGTEAAELPRRFERRLRERLAALTGTAGVDAARLAQEVAIMAERLDVSEELTRLGVHLDHLGRLLASSEPVGRKLDFAIQEVGRELNTVASKAQDATVAGLVIDAKAELEKMREQVQNVE